MRNILKYSAAAAALLVAGHIATANAGVITIQNASFETPVVGTGNYGDFQYNPSNAGWIFLNGAGVAGQGSAWFDTAPPDGVQAGFIQNNGSISQILTGLSVGDGYTLQFYLADRKDGYPPDPISVTFSGSTVSGLTFTPTSTTFQRYSIDFVATDTTGTLTFAGTLPGYDFDTIIDSVSLVPEPASMALLGGGIAAIGLLRRKRR